MKTFRNTSFFVIILIVISLTSCGKMEELQIGDITNIQLKGFSNNLVTLQVTVPVKNPNPYRLTIKGGDINVSAFNTELGKVKQMDNLTLAAKSAKDYTINIVVEITNMAGGLSSAYKLAQGDNANIRLSGKIKVQYFLYSKTIEIEDYKISR